MVSRGDDLRGQGARRAETARNRLAAAAVCSRRGTNAALANKKTGRPGFLPGRPARLPKEGGYSLWNLVNGIAHEQEFVRPRLAVLFAWLLVQFWQRGFAAFILSLEPIHQRIEISDHGLGRDLAAG